jgi:hypothetical protein
MKNQFRIAIALLGIIAPCWKAAAQQPACEGRTVDSAMRTHRAVKIVEPRYPKEAIDSRTTGLVIVAVCVPLGGDTATAHVVTSPSQSLTDAVIDALSQWRFKTPEKFFGSNKPRSYGANMMFYFTHQKTGWIVFNPSEEFYVGPEFGRLGQSEK